MKKEELLKLYKDYLQRNKKKSYVCGFCGERYKLIDRAYLESNPVLKDEPLPQYLSAEQLNKLDEQYNHTLTWQILDSDVTDEQIAEFELENEIMLPKSFREFVQGYSFLHSRFYPECAEYKCSRLEVDFFGISNPNGLQHYKDNEFPPIKKVKYMDVASIGEQWISLDCETGVVRSWWSDELAGEACSKEEYEEESGEGDFWFKDFDDFLEWLFGKRIYNFRKATEEKYNFYHI